MLYNTLKLNALICTALKLGAILSKTYKNLGYGQDLGLEWNSLQAGDKKQAVEMTGE